MEYNTKREQFIRNFGLIRIRLIIWQEYQRMQGMHSHHRQSLGRRDS